MAAGRRLASCHVRPSRSPGSVGAAFRAGATEAWRRPVPDPDALAAGPLGQPDGVSDAVAANP